MFDNNIASGVNSVRVKNKIRYSKIVEEDGETISINYYTQESWIQEATEATKAHKTVYVDFDGTITLCEPCDYVLFDSDGEELKMTPTLKTDVVGTEERVQKLKDLLSLPNVVIACSRSDVDDVDDILCVLNKLIEVQARVVVRDFVKKFNNKLEAIEQEFYQPDSLKKDETAYNMFHVGLEPTTSDS